MFSFSNKIFRVNGRSLENLKLTLSLVLSCEYDGEIKKPYSVSKSEKGLIFHDYNSAAEKFLTPLTLDTIFEMAKAYLSEVKIEDIELKDWEVDLDHDGSNKIGWEIYTEDWGKIDGVRGFAIKPVYLWYGK